MQGSKKYYAGIGSRETPPGIEPMIEETCKILEKFGYILRSGGAPGADSTFEKYTTGEKEIYLPWRGFNDNSSEFYLDNMDIEFVQKAKSMAMKYHPQVLGSDLQTPVSFVVCWTQGGKIAGGTGQALRIAKDLSIPIFNLYDKDCLYKIKLQINK